MPDLYQYLEYRAFLRDYYEERHGRDRYFSYRFLGNRLGMDSSYLIRVIQEKKHLSDDLVQRVCDVLKFDPQQSRYFSNLVGFNKAKTDAQARAFYERMIAERGVAYHQVRQDQMEYFSKWYVVALRNLLDYTGFDGDYESLGKKLRPAISAEETKQALFLLERLQMIKKEPGGFKVLDVHVHTGEQWASDSIALFQESTLQLALRSLKEDPRTVRDISTMTMNISAGNLQEIRDLIREFQENVAKLVEMTAESDRVYQLNLQLFPMSQWEGSR